VKLETPDFLMQFRLMVISAMAWICTINVVKPRIAVVLLSVFHKVGSIRQWPVELQYPWPRDLSLPTSKTCCGLGCCTVQCTCHTFASPFHSDFCEFGEGGASCLVRLVLLSRPYCGMIRLPRKVGIYKQMYMMLSCEIFRAALYKALRNILK